ncbi:CGNR zinc finger domain-containing protein [Humibacter soli]
MPFNHDNMIGVRLAEDLVNLEWEGRWDAASVFPVLRGAFVTMTDIRQLDEDAMRRLRAWAGHLRRPFAADGPHERADRINELLSEGVRIIRLATHDGLPPHLHFADAESELVQRIKALTAGGLAIFAVEAEAERMGVCARPGCERVFADTSKNGRRAYCTSVCGNTHAVLRYRERKAAISR